MSATRPILINDHGTWCGDLVTLASTLDFTVVHAASLGALLRLDPIEYQPPTVVLTVGRGGKTVLGHLQGKKTSSEVIHVHAVSWDRSNSVPLVTTSSIERNPIVDPNIGLIIVLDDVVSSGTTLELIAERNAWRFPRADWYASVWLTRRAKLKGYNRLYASMMISHPHGQRVPINSVSTLQGNHALAVSYARKHFGLRAQEFLTAIGR